MEPNWTDIKCRMTALTLKELRPVKGWFSGCFGGVSDKAATIGVMISQMQHWWRSCADMGGHERVKNVLKTLEEVEFFKEGA
jgi:hypothetical protein